MTNMKENQVIYHSIHWYMCAGVCYYASHENCFYFRVTG